MIPQLQQIFHSITKSLEVLYVIEGAKPCARIMVFEDELENVKKFLSQKELFFQISEFKVLKQNLHSESYSDKSIKLQKNAPQNGHFFVYLSKDKKIAAQAKIAEEKNNHKELGLLLGYPECCCDFFVNNFDEKNTDLTLKALTNSNGFEFSFYNNIAARHFDITLLSHFPHSYECMPSIEIAKGNIKIIHKHSKQLAEMFSGVLRSLVIYTLEEGIFLIRNHEKIKNGILYSHILSTAKSKLYFLLSANKQLKIINKNSFVVNDVHISGENYGAMIFT